MQNPVGLAISLAIGLSCAVGVRLLPLDESRLLFSIIAVTAGGLSAFIIWTAGPALAIAVCAYPSYAAACFLFFNRRVATIATALTVIGYATVVSLAEGYPRPFVNVFFLAATTLATAVPIARLVNRIEALSSNERRLHTEVVHAREELKLVVEQVDEIERLGKLRRFLSPQVAEAVVSHGAADVLSTHRRQIAVVFVDFRGFTSFSAVAEPEDVVELLTEFYAAVGDVVKRLDATVGAFAGASWPTSTTLCHATTQLDGHSIWPCRCTLRWTN